MKKIAILLLLLLMVTPIVQPKTVDASKVKEYNFTDVRKNNSHYEGINYLFEEGFIGGVRVGPNKLEFRPQAPIKRSEVTAIFASILGLPIPEDHEALISGFEDIDVNHPFVLSIGSNIEHGIFRGDGNQFKDNILNREQMATVLVRAFELKKKQSTVPKDSLHNVSESHKKAVEILLEHQITTEVKDYRPKEKVTRAQFNTFLYRSMKAIGLEKFNIAEDRGHYFGESIRYAFMGVYLDAGFIDSKNTPNYHLDLNVEREQYLKATEYAVAYPNSFILLNNQVEVIHVPSQKKIMSTVRNKQPKYSEVLLTAPYNKPEDVPLPKGTTYEQLEREQKFSHRNIKGTNNLKYLTYFFLFAEDKRALEDSIGIRSFNMGPTKDQRIPIEPEKLVEIINWTIETGQVYDGGHFAMYYDFKKGLINMLVREVDFNS